jgi:phenylacetic acid degradation operon negative regulatory protein
LSRRHAAGAPSARGLLLTLLGEFVLTGDETAWTSAVLATFGGLGIEEKTTRQALMRTAAAGWLDAEKLGRRTRWRLTVAARRMLTDGAARIYSFTGPDPGWDGRWLLISARIPESDRRARHVLRTRLSWAGFGSLGPALWVSPHPDREAEAIRVLREAGIADDAHVFVARRSGLGDERTMVATAWDLTAIEDQYAQFIEEFGPELPESSHPESSHPESSHPEPGHPEPGQPESGLPGPEDALGRQIELVHAWRRFPALDPALPRELLPARWSGLAAARLFGQRHQQWSAAAGQQWRRLNDVG